VFAVASAGVFLAVEGPPGQAEELRLKREREREAERTPPVAPPELGKAHGGGGNPHGTHGAISRSQISTLPMTEPVLTVDGVTFTHADLERAISQHAVVAGIPPMAIDAQMRDALEQPAYEKLIERQLLGQEAKRRGLWPNDAAVQEQKQKLMSTLPPGKSLDDALKAMNTDEQHFMADLASDVAIGALFDAMKKEAPPPDEAALKKFYEDNKDRFRTKDTAQALHILVRVGKDAKPDEVNAALEKAKAIRKEVAGKDVETFKKVATEKSEDPSAKQNGGDLGMFARGDMVPQFEEAAFKLKKDEVSEPVRSDFGWHIIRGGGTTKGEQKSFDDVKQMIADRQGMKGFMERVDQLIQQLRSTAKITRVHEPIASPFALEDGQGSQVPAWKPTGHNADPNATNPHGG
jgi:peptidyl-prolyl cis-trans isomerase C